MTDIWKGERLRIGMVCPYSLDGPGGVQTQVLGLAQYMLDRGHDVSVLAPARAQTLLPDYVERAGCSFAIPYNGSVAHLKFGPISALRVRRWLRRGEFDIVHVHEPAVPSLSMLALLAAKAPVVGTMHTVNPRSRAMRASRWWLRPLLGRLSARIAVSEAALHTMANHVGGDAVVIPNGLDIEHYRTAERRSEWVGLPERRTIAMVGRLDEPRKGLAVLAEALPRIKEVLPGVRLLLVGPGVGKAVRGTDGVEFLGRLDDNDKARLLRSVDVYVAPHTGRESFGLVLVEAMSAGSVVVASNLPAFEAVLEVGRLGVLFPVGDPQALADSVLGLLQDPQRKARLVAAAQEAVERYGWERVGAQVLAVYCAVLSSRHRDGH
jgi:phosphatidylinositol alpha-mannosyltransferase